MEMYHINEEPEGKCPLCRHTGRLQVHIHEDHVPAEASFECPREPGPLYAFALVVCQRADGKFLLVQEFSNQGFWLPGGGVDTGEDLREAAIRETLEEGGVAVKLTGILSLQFSPHKRYTRMRIIFLAKPVDDAASPKTIPDFESVGAVWATYSEVLAGLPLRGQEPARWFAHVANGGHVSPMSLLGDER